MALALYVMGEGAFFAALIMLTPLWFLVSPFWVGRVIVGEVACQTMLATTCAFCDRRKDVLLSCLVFPLLRLVDCSVFLVAFWCVMVRRQQIHTWFAPKRY
jgi:hypothetical protein